MISPAIIRVTSPSFSAHERLAAELTGAFPAAVLNTAGTRLSGDALAGWLGDADAAIIGLEQITEAVLEACPRLRVIAKYGVGLDNVDLDACARRGVTVGWTAGTNARSVAELTLACMLGLCRNVFAGSALLKAGTWRKSGGVQLSGRTVGLIGLGHVGKDVAGLVSAFGCRVLACDILDQRQWCRDHAVEQVSLDDLLAQSDVVTLHVPLTDLTRGMINRNTLARMRSTAILINTSRGPVVDQGALKQALMSGTIQAAALDVYEAEPPEDREFLMLPNLVCTPHIGGSADEAILAMGRAAIGHLVVHFTQPQSDGPGAAR